VAEWWAFAAQEREASRLEESASARVAAALSGLGPSAPVPLERLRTPRKKLELRYEISSTRTPENLSLFLSV